MVQTKALALLLLGALPCGAAVTVRPSVPISVGSPALGASAAALGPALGATGLAPLALSVPTLAAPALAPLPRVTPAPSLDLPAPLSEMTVGLERAAQADFSGLAQKGFLDAFYGGGKASGSGAVFLLNDEGVEVTGRAAVYYQEVRRLVEKLEGQADLKESLDVMDDSYADVWAKLKAIEAIAQKSEVEKHNTHLEETLTWVDGVLHKDGKTIAVNTHRVYFHKADNPRSEIEEGIRRVDGYLKEAARQFAPGGGAEQALGGRLDQVVLAFDTRGYDEIKRHLKAREAELRGRFGARFQFAYLDELAKMPASTEQTRFELNALAAKYKGKGLQKIVEGVIYSRYVGLLLELKTVEHFLEAGYKVLQSGRELFDTQGKYVTEIDAVVRAPDGKVLIVEAKSARVPLPNEEVLREKVLRKLDTYTSNRPQLEAAMGAALGGVLFSFDVGRNEGLKVFLMGQEKALSRKYGLPVSFVFLDSGPEGSQPGRRAR